MQLKGPQIGPKMRFFKFQNELKEDKFLIFCMNLQQHKGFKLSYTIVFYLQKFYFGIFGSKLPSIVASCGHVFSFLKFGETFIKLTPPVLKKFL